MLGIALCSRVDNDEAAIPQAGQDGGDVFPREAAESTAQSGAVDRGESVMIGEVDGFSGGTLNESERRGLRP